MDLMSNRATMSNLTSRRKNRNWVSRAAAQFFEWNGWCLSLDSLMCCAVFLHRLLA